VQGAHHPGHAGAGAGPRGLTAGKAATTPSLSTDGTRERALIVGLALGPRRRQRTTESLEELELLARSAGASVVGSVVQERTRRDPATLVGRGKVEEVAGLSEELDANVLVFDDDLSPAQQRNIEEIVGIKTLDRTQLILDIFAHRARTREGRLQVELAQLEYFLPRLAGRGILLSRLGGGIGTRGPGETKLETDRRRIRQRIQAVRREIEHVRRERLTRREARRRREAPVVALVGYTNAGKSTLFNTLSRGGAAVSDQLFVTLDPLVRRVALGGGRQIMVVDTVGFIQKLPHALVAAFRATLEEVVEADLLLHVVDASAPGQSDKRAAVDAVLQEIGAGARPRILVLNKSDLSPVLRSSAIEPGAVLVSARTGEGIGVLLASIASRLDLEPRRVRLRFRSADTGAISAVYAAGRVLEHEVQGEEVTLQAELPERLLARYRENLQ
jgi:GTP-binding protein HflX